MTTLRFTDYPLSAAPLGNDSSLPDIHVNGYIRAHIAVSDKISGEDGKYIGKGMISTLLPYKITDGYSRDRRMRRMNAAVLENEHIRATFFPELGGRLWSLYDKKRDRELLYRNDVFQPANLALRNAWFSGGVEWNVGIKGHNPLTCSPLFAQRAVNQKGEPILRMYELERIRGVVYVIEAALQKDALIMNITIENTADTDTYMYWWSNIAVPETPATRVITPASEAFYCAYTDGKYFLDKADMPCIEGKDITYAANSRRSRDFFFNIPENEKKWIAAIDGDGHGLLQLSDPILKGRKLFVWGQHTGGRNWGQWLTENAGSYIEIQAGLLKTQLEHFVMKKQSVISFRECYCAIDADPSVIHGDFFRAADAILPNVEERMPLLDPSLFDLAKVDAPSLYGSGWGALEEKLRQRPISALCQFPVDSMGDAEADFLALLDGKPLPSHDADTPIKSYVVGKPWIALLEKHPQNDWYYYNLLGVLRYADGDIDGAKACFEASLTACENAWARRNLAQIQKNILGDLATAADNMLLAAARLPHYLPLAVECLQTLLKAERYDTFLSFHQTLPASVREHGRIRMLLGDCYARMGKTDEARALVTEDLVVPDIMEGEYALSHIWIRIYRQVLAKERSVAEESLTDDEVLSIYPIPASLDFRMH